MLWLFCAGRAGEKGSAYTLVTDKDKEFAGHLVRNLEGANQDVPDALLDLAMQVGSVSFLCCEKYLPMNLHSFVLFVFFLPRVHGSGNLASKEARARK